MVVNSLSDIFFLLPISSIMTESSVNLCVLFQITDKIVN